MLSQKRSFLIHLRQPILTLGMEAAELEGVHSGCSRSDSGLRYPPSTPIPANQQSVGRLLT
jgi:hypothetical protein